MCTKFLSENPKGRNHSEDLGVDGRIILEWIIVIHGSKFCIVFILRKLGTSGRLL
jgi:hypothetical protein